MTDYNRIKTWTIYRMFSDEKDLVPNPILIKNKNNIEIITEKILHNSILEDVVSFMKELSIGYSFRKRI